MYYSPICGGTDQVSWYDGLKNKSVEAGASEASTFPSGSLGMRNLIF